jgi:SAM-dependent methyltransferase
MDMENKITIINILKKLLMSIKESGIKNTLVRILDNFIFNRELRMFIDRFFDFRYGVDTSGVVHVEDLDINILRKETAQQYEPCPVSAIRTLHKRLKINYSNYTFIDFGSGKGQVLLVASEYPYQNIMGVEFSEKLHKIAENNIRIWKSYKQKCFKIESICIDAVDFKLPQNPLVLFFFSPFKGMTAEKIIKNIRDDFFSNPRSIIVIFYGTNREFIDVLSKLNFSYDKEIFCSRPLPALKHYKGYILRSNNIFF